MSEQDELQTSVTGKVVELSVAVTLTLLGEGGHAGSGGMLRSEIIEFSLIHREI